MMAMCRLTNDPPDRMRLGDDRGAGGVAGGDGGNDVGSGVIPPLIGKDGSMSNKVTATPQYTPSAREAREHLIELIEAEYRAYLTRTEPYRKALADIDAMTPTKYTMLYDVHSALPTT